MDFDFNIVLVPLTLALAVIWLLDKLVLKQRRHKGKGNENFFVRLAYDFFPILAVVLIVRSFIIEPFNIPSSSMVPTLYTGDFIAVNKFAYGLRLPLTYQKILDTGEPQHGDVMVFRYPQNPSIYYIKRAIGLPGDTVSYDSGVVSVNGQPITGQQVSFSPEIELTQQLIPSGTLPTGDVLSSKQAAQLSQKEESFAQYFKEVQGEHEHLVRYLKGFSDNQSAPFLREVSPEVMSSDGQKWQVTVPEGQYFVMGDNRDRSADGRYWGFMPEQNLAGKAVYIWMHKQPGLMHLPTFARNGHIN